jgi:hypothetical protein
LLLSLLPLLLLPLMLPLLLVKAPSKLQAPPRLRVLLLLTAPAPLV